MGSRNGVRLTRTVRKKTARERWDRKNLEMIVAVPWRKNEYDAKMDRERQQAEAVMMDKSYNERLEMDEHVPEPKRVCTTREDLEVFGFTARCLAQGRRDKRTQKTAEGGLEEKMRSTVSAEAAQRRVKEDQNKAAESGTKRTMWSSEEGQTDAPTTTSSRSNSSSSGDAARTGSSREGNRSNTVDNKRNADGEHREDPEREDGKVDEDGGKQAKDSRRRGREHAEENREVPEETQQQWNWRRWK